jgi:hypothetical protein
MKRKYLLIIFFSAAFFVQQVSAQTYCMPTTGVQTFITTTGNFYDSGCNNLNYSNNENGVITFCPGTSCYEVINMYVINLNDAGDILRFYSGNSTSGPILFTYQGHVSLIGPAPHTSTDSINGCITVSFISNSSLTGSGWSATLGCSFTTGIAPSTDLFNSYISSDLENNSLNLTLSSPSSFTLHIFSSDGKKISQKNYSLSSGQHQLNLPTQHLSQGMYFCRVAGEGVNKSFKFVKQ